MNNYRCRRTLSSQVLLARVGNILICLLDAAYLRFFVYVVDILYILTGILYEHYDLSSQQVLLNEWMLNVVDTILILFPLVPSTSTPRRVYDTPLRLSELSRNLKSMDG